MLTCGMGGIVLVETPLTTAPLLWPLLLHVILEPFWYFKVICLVDGLALRNPFNMNKPMGVEEIMNMISFDLFILSLVTSQ